MTEDQGRTWQRIFDGGAGEGQSKTTGRGLGYVIGLALNPKRQGELLVTAGDRPPGGGLAVGPLAGLQGRLQGERQPCCRAGWGCACRERRSCW